MAQFARVCVIMAPAFQRRCGTVCSILSSLPNPKGWEWAWQLCARLLNRTAARSQLRTLMEAARGLDLSFRSTDLRHSSEAFGAASNFLARKAPLSDVGLRSNMGASDAGVVFTCFARSTPRPDLPSRRRSFRVERPQSPSYVGRLAPRTIQRSRSLSKLCEASSAYGCHHRCLDAAHERPRGPIAGAGAFAID